MDGREFRKLREDLGLSQEQLGQVLGLAPGNPANAGRTVRGWEEDAPTGPAARLMLMIVGAVRLIRERASAAGGPAESVALTASDEEIRVVAAIAAVLELAVIPVEIVAGAKAADQIDRAKIAAMTPRRRSRRSH